VSQENSDKTKTRGLKKGRKARRGFSVSGNSKASLPGQICDKNLLNHKSKLMNYLCVAFFR